MNVSRTHPNRRRGFTLVELLVVIAIIAVLAVLATLAAQSGLNKARAARALENLRQSGIVLLSNAQDNNGKMQYSKKAYDDVEDQPPLMPYNIIRKQLGLRYVGAQSHTELCICMHWDPVKLKPEIYHLNCFGVNITDLLNPGDPSAYIAEWKDEEITIGASPGTKIMVDTLLTTAVSRPEAYPILLDSSDAQGNETFRISEIENGFVGLRNSGRANGYFLDGSARSMGKDELRSVGFTKAYDNKTVPPKAVNL